MNDICYLRLLLTNFSCLFKRLLNDGIDELKLLKLCNDSPINFKKIRRD